MKTKLDWVELALVAAPFVILAAVWNDLPQRVPIHWNLNGEIDRWSSKEFGVLFLPVTAAVTIALARVLPWMDPKVRRAGGDTGRMFPALQIVRLAIAAFFCLISAVQIGAALGHSFSVGRVVLSGTLLLLAVLGNYLGNLRPNYFFGIRTPWTLESPETWRATHRVGGRLMFFGSVALLLLGFVVTERLFFLLVIGGALALAVWGFVFSWHHFRTHGGAARVH